MKIILIFIVTLSLNLFARMNPFEATNTFNEQKANYAEEQNKIQLQKIQNEQKQLKKELFLMKKQNAEANKIAKELKIQTEINKKVKKLAKKESFSLLPFVKIEIYKGILTIIVDKKYKLLNQDILKKERKILFDFKGNISFYTIRKNIKHKDFKSFAIGTHRRKNFFRVVIDLSDDLIQYTEKVNGKKGVITIKHL
jgi:hypothetical protein